MDIEIFSTLPLGTNCFLCTHDKKAVLIDAGFGIAELIKPSLEAFECTLEAVLLTHSHWDHIAGLKEIQSLYSVKTYCHPYDAPNVSSPGVDGVPTMMDTAPAQVDAPLAEGDLLKIGGMSFRVLHTPGHSPGSVVFLSEESNTLFSGDTLFEGTCGNVSFPSSSPEDMAHSLARLSKLKKNFTVYPGHGRTTTLDAEAWIEGAASLI